MSRWRILVCMAALMSCVACHDSEQDADDAAADFENFRSTVRNDAGEPAFDCGHVARDADRSAVHCCMVSHFADGVPAFATYVESSIDSFISIGVSNDAGGGVTYFFYDLNPVPPGQPLRPGRISQEECPLPFERPLACSSSGGKPILCIPPQEL